MTIRKGVIFKARSLFEGYVNNLYRLKQNSVKNSVDYIISKLMLNSLYGRFGMSPYLEKHVMVNESELDKLIENFKVKNIVDLNNKMLLISYENEDNDENTHSILNTSISVSAAITAEARLFMNHFILSKDYNVYYHDTDSICIDKPLPPQYVGPELGQFKLEHKFDEGIFISPKVYGGYNPEYTHIKVKGLKNPMTYDQLKVLLQKDSILNITQEKWYKNISEGHIKIMNEVYTLMATENKRKLVYNNENFCVNTEPFVIDETNPTI